MQKQITIHSFGENPVVSIIMGSSSDLKRVAPVLIYLCNNKISFEVAVVSAHRTAEVMVMYAKSVRGRGIKVIIAAAGGAAHLPGMVASLTPVPVIGIAVNSSNSINGIDSLLSIAQMPAGVPVASVGIDDALGAGILAKQILDIGKGSIGKVGIVKVCEAADKDITASAKAFLDKNGVPHFTKTLLTSNFADLPKEEQNAFFEEANVVIMSMSNPIIHKWENSHSRPVIVVPPKLSDTLETITLLTKISSTDPAFATVGTDNYENAGILAAKFLATGNNDLMDKIALHHGQLELKVARMNEGLKAEVDELLKECK